MVGGLPSLAVGVCLWYYLGFGPRPRQILKLGWSNGKTP